MSLFDDMAKAAVADVGNKYQEVVFGQQAPEAVPEQPAPEAATPSVGGSVSVAWPATDLPSAWEAQVQQAQPPQQQDREPPAPDHDLDR